jgi:AcrR family transcriptional regulator
MDRSFSTQTLPDRLLRAAIDEFGRRGVEGASTRAIAAAAGTTMSMITYHHGSKEGLYLAAAKRIAGEIGERITPALAAAGAIGGDDESAALARLLALVDEFVGVMVCPESEAWARFIVREQMDPTPAFDILYGGVMGRLVDHLSELVGRASGGRIGPAEARLRTLAIVGQALVFRFARATVLRATGWTGIEEDEAAAIRRVVRAHTTAILADAAGHTQA